jgi:hypothetical protein
MTQTVMTIHNKDINGILPDYYGLSININKYQKEGQKLFLNIRNIQSILSDYTNKTITIAMANSDKYEIICGENLNKRYDEIMRIFQNFESRLTPSSNRM